MFFLKYSLSLLVKNDTKEAVFISIRSSQVEPQKTVIRGALKTVVTINNNTSLTITTSQGQEVTVELAENAQIWVDGQVAKVGDLKSGQRIQLILSGSLATKIHAWSIHLVN